MSKKHWTVYKAFDKSIHYREDKAELVDFYNFKNSTNYKYISEFVQALFEQKVSVYQIAKLLEVTHTAVYVLLEKIGVRASESGNSPNIVYFSDEDIRDIRKSDKFQRELAVEYGCSLQTIGNVIRKDGRFKRI